MPRESRKQLPEGLFGLLFQRALCLFVFIGALVILVLDWDVDTQVVLVPVLAAAMVGMIVLSILVRRKRLETPPGARRIKPRKAIWELASGGKKYREPYATYALIGVLGFLFLLEMGYAPDRAPHSFFAPGVRSLVMFGATNPDLVVAHGQWYRLFTSVLLHGGVEHFLLNALALWMAGMVLERLVGWPWFVAAFALCGLAGNLVSLALASPNVVGVGASGAIMGLLGTGLVVSGRLPKGPDRKKLQGALGRILILNLIPTSKGVDYGAHLGGALAGLAMGLFLYRIWRNNAPNPAWNGWGKGLAFAGIGIYAVALGFVAAS